MSFLWVSVFMFCDLDFSQTSIFLHKPRNRGKWQHNLICSDIQELGILMNSGVIRSMNPKVSRVCREGSSPETASMACALAECSLGISQPAHDCQIARGEAGGVEPCSFRW